MSSIYSSNSNPVCMCIKLFLSYDDMNTSSILATEVLAGEGMIFQRANKDGIAERT
jgi:hypothetical protein